MTAPLTKNTTTNVLSFNYDTNDFDVFNNNLTLISRTTGVTTPLTIDNTTKNIKLNYDTTDFTITNTNK